MCWKLKKYLIWAYKHIYVLGIAIQNRNILYWLLHKGSQQIEALYYMYTLFVRPVQLYMIDDDLINAEFMCIIATTYMNV